MPFLEKNDARLYYETFGEDAPGRPPIVLVHGSTITGRADWGLVAPLLARSYRVIVPDCRGHGQSANPRMSYSFREMADDTAALIRALGYERAHVIGHSNGGNVALVTLLEHPDVVQTAVLQAANAYVTPYLREREPAIFDPERVARDAPEWMDEMIALHSATHGTGYWRELLALTLRETLAAPGYTAADLAAVRRPVLVVQGERDQVNAPPLHGQFIAQNIPDAESWLPAEVGHDVHHDALFAWVDQVLGFLRRRGDDTNDALYRLRRSRYADTRSWVFDVRAEPPAIGDGTGVRLAGSVLAAEQRDAALDLFPGAAHDDLRVLLDAATPWALIGRAVTDLRGEPGMLAERLSQALLGEVVRVLEERGEWAFVRLERDGYLGWVSALALHRCGADEARRHAAGGNALVVAELATAYAALPPSEGAPAAGKLPFGITAAVEERRGGWARLRLPDGARWWCAEPDLLPLDDRPTPDAAGVARALALIERFVGVPYLWGGRTPFGYDCSGLAQTFLSLMGIRAPRDADQQFGAGTPVEAPFRPGDLLFFGDAPEEARDDDSFGASRRITHVAISLGGEECIHANGSAGGVSLNSLDPDSPRYRPWLRESLAGARRFV